MSKSFSLPGIKTIAYMASNLLPQELCMQSLAGMPIYVSADMFNVPFNGEPTCECTLTNASNGPSESVQFTFRANEVLPSEYHLAFLVIDANNDYYLIGTKEEHPLIERVRSFGTPESDPSTHTYTVSLTAPRALIPCRMN